jgi:chromosome segregation ATPase
MYMMRFFTFLGLAGLLLLSSCDKHNVLLREKAAIEASVKQANEEMRAVDLKFEALRARPIPYGLTLERQLEEEVKRNKKLEEELAFLSRKCADGEDVLKRLRPSLDSYKAKYLR